MKNLWLIGSILALILLASALFGAIEALGDIERLHPAPDLAPSVDLSAKKDTLDEWLDLLAKYENCAPEGTMDSGSLSYGPFCYKKGTFLMFVKKFNLLSDVEDEEVFNLIGDPDFQRRLTRLVFEDSYRYYTHWYTSIVKRGLGLPPKPDS